MAAGVFFQVALELSPITIRDLKGIVPMMYRLCANPNPMALRAPRLIVKVHHFQCVINRFFIHTVHFQALSACFPRWTLGPEKLAIVSSLGCFANLGSESQEMEIGRRPRLHMR
jgi:hypothetical protein